MNLSRIGKDKEFNKNKRYVYSGYSFLCGRLEYSGYAKKYIGREVYLLDNDLCFKAWMNDCSDLFNMKSVGVYSWNCIDDTKRLNYIDKRNNLRKNKNNKRVTK